MKFAPARWVALFAAIWLALPATLCAAEGEDSTPADVASWTPGVGTDVADCDCDCHDSCCDRYLYISAIAGVSFMNGQSGGFNTLGPHNNTGSDNDQLFLAGGAIGVAIPLDFGTLRIEFEGRGRNNFRGVTDSFEPPIPTFFYDVEMSDGWSTMVNAWFDVPVRDKFAVYGGGGIGGAGYHLSVNDTISSGSGSVSEFAWQAGAGVIYRVNDRIELDFGYRYSDLGTADIGLNEIIGGADAGNYTLAVTTHDLLLQLRINEPLSLLRR